MWRAGAGRPGPSAREWKALSQPERDRALRFRFDRDRVRFVRSHAALREILSRYLEVPPGEIRFTEGERGKPSIEPPNRLAFNLSHAGDFALIAVATDRAVGVDVELVRPGIDFAGMAERVLTPGEREDLSRLDPAARLPAFFAGWARKEALVKAFGLGVSFPLERIEVSLDPEETAPLRWVQDAPPGGPWEIRTVEVGEGYAAAVAASGWDWGVRCRRYPAG